MPQRIRDLLNGVQRERAEFSEVNDDQPACPAPPRRLPIAWRDPHRQAELGAALALIASIRNPLWRRRFRERVEADHPTPRNIRRGVTLLSCPTVRLWVLHACCTAGCAIPKRDEPLQTPRTESNNVVRLRTARPPERAAAS
jgi:hypothetical protein